LSLPLISSLGVGVLFIILSLMYRAIGMSFIAEQSVAALVAMTFNFVLSDLITHGIAG
jgi:hypothetical protein